MQRQAAQGMASRAGRPCTREPPDSLLRPQRGHRVPSRCSACQTFRTETTATKETHHSPERDPSTSPKPPGTPPSSTHTQLHLQDLPLRSTCRYLLRRDPGGCICMSEVAAGELRPPTLTAAQKEHSLWKGHSSPSCSEYALILASNVCGRDRGSGESAVFVNLR